MAKYLLIDEQIQLTGSTIKEQIRNTKPTTLHPLLTPTTKKQMHILADSSVDALMVTPGRPFISKTLLKVSVSVNFNHLSPFTMYSHLSCNEDYCGNKKAQFYCVMLKCDIIWSCFTVPT